MRIEALMSKKTVLCLLLVSAAIMAAWPSWAAEAEGPEQLSFGKFCARVVAYYPKLAKEGESVEMAIARRWEAYAGFLPKITGSISMTTSDDQVYVFGTLLKQRSFTNSDFLLTNLNNPASRTNYNGALYGELPIFDAMQTIYRVKASRFMLESAKQGMAFIRMEAVLVATEAYMHALSVESSLRIAEATAADSGNDVKQAEDLKAKGMILGADYYAARVMYGNIRSAKNELIEEKRRSDALLNILMGEDPLRPVVLSGALPEDPGEEPRPLDAWLTDALRSREDLHSIDSAISARRSELDREKATALPRISGFGNLQENTQNFVKGGGSFAVGLKGDIDLFDATYYGRVKEARASLKALEYDRMMLSDAIKKDVSEEYSRYKTVIMNMPVLKDMAGDSKEAVDLTIPLYREGRKSIADLLEMRQSCLYANRTYYNILAGSTASKAKLLFVSGALYEAKALEMVEGRQR